MRLNPRRLLPLALLIAMGAALPAIAAPKAAPAPTGAAAGYAGTHFGDGNIPAGCITTIDENDPDNRCFHMKVGLNALDSPEVNVAVLVPVSPAAERDMRLAKQAVDMWAGGIKDLANQMNLQWLAKGVHFHVTTQLVPVDKDGIPTAAIRLVSPKIVVIATNPAGGIGIGIDPFAFVGELGLTDSNGLPCVSIPNPFSMDAWKHRKGFDDHHGDLGGIYVTQCASTGGNVCFSVNGAVDPIPGKTDFFSIYDLVAHETGHCLTLGHVGDGADGPWGPTATNDIMAYSSDPPGLAKCASTLDVEGFALRMSNFLDVNGDGKVDELDHLTPNDKAGDGLNSFQVQNPADHRYASPTGEPADCPQPDWGTLPGEQTNWEPTNVATQVPNLRISSATTSTGRLTWAATAEWLAAKPVVAHAKVSVQDAVGDGTIPQTDITGFTASATPTTVHAVLHVSQLWPTTQAGRVNAYSLFVSGRKFDSFVTTQGTSSDVQTIDSGGRYIMPAGTSTWDSAASTVTFNIPRQYLTDNRIHAPYQVATETGVHIRTKDWVTTLDEAPDGGKTVGLSAPTQAPDHRDVPLSKTVTTRSVELQHKGGNTFTPADTSDEGIPLVPAIGNVHEIDLPISKQSSVEVTLSWDDPASALGLSVDGGSGQTSKPGTQSVTVTVPWAHRQLEVHVTPSQILAPSVHYTVKAKITTLVKDADHDGVPDVGDKCKDAAGPADSGGCPDTDKDGILDLNDKCPRVAGLGTDGCTTAANEKVIAYLDGRQVAKTFIMTRHGKYDFSGSTALTPGKHTLKIEWWSGARIVKTISSVVS